MAAEPDVMRVPGGAPAAILVGLTLVLLVTGVAVYFSGRRRAAREARA